MLKITSFYWSQNNSFINGGRLECLTLVIFLTVGDDGPINLIFPFSGVTLNLMSLYDGSYW